VSFKTCGNCRHIWADRDGFLADPGLRLVGYQCAFDDLGAGLFLFAHSCGTTLALKAESCVDLYAGPVYQERRTGQADCPGHCLHRDELRPCPARCECAFVREVLQVIAAYPKRGFAPGVT